MYSILFDSQSYEQMIAAMDTFTHEKTNDGIVCPEDPKTTIWVQVYLGGDARKNQEDTGKGAQK